MAFEVGLSPIQGKDVILTITDDNGTSTWTLVCAEKQSYKASRDVKQRVTQCGTVVGTSASVKRSITFDGVFSQVAETLTLGKGYCSGPKLKEWLNNATPLVVTQEYDDGSKLSNSYGAYISDYSENDPIDDVVDFTVEFTLFDTTP